jgi:hypothetical protein
LLSAGVSAQQLSVPGIPGPAEPKIKSQQDTPIQIRAARGEAPVGRLYGNVKADSSKLRRLPALSQRAVREEASTLKRLRVGTVRAFQRPLDLSSDSALYRVTEGEVRVMGVVSEGALYTRVHFTGMALPEGARVFVYSLKNPEEFYGPYENRGPSGDGAFWTPPMEGDGAVIEYFTPSGKGDSEGAPFQVSEISHTYRDPAGKVEAGAENATAGACNLDVTGDWSQVATSVGRLQFTSGGSEYLCTGTLLNNQTNDHTPYLLTANHCFDTQTEAQTLRVYWNHNSGEFPPAGTPRTDGATLLATGAASDFTFVRLTGALPAGLFFSGWDATATPLLTTVTGIHHPQGSYKRISFGATISACGSGLPGGNCQNYTNARWSSGTTEGGSSGSGIWKGTPADARLVGTLTGGAASCSNLLGTDYYGSFSTTYPFIATFLQRGDTEADDKFEENDTRATARPLADGTHSNLVIKGSDEDWYKVSVVGGGPVGIRMEYTRSAGAIEMQLFRGSEVSPADTSPAGSTDSPRVRSINQSAGTVDYYLKISAQPGVLQNSYALNINGTGPVCSPVAITQGQTINASLSSSDCRSALRIANFSDTYYSDRYSFTAQQGQQVAITMTPATTFNTYLVVQGVDAQVVYQDSPTIGKPGSVATFTAPSTGTYTIEASSYNSGVTGNYSLTLAGQPDTIAASQSTYTVSEGAGRVAIVVNRGPGAVGPASVEYSTGEASIVLNVCSNQTTVALAKCDYAHSIGTLRFAAGEKSKTIYIPLVDDSFSEPEETFNLYLSNPLGATGGGPDWWKTVIKISDNDSVTGGNPAGQTPFFVRQHYIDFLGREPDPVGYQAWQNTINNCPPSGRDANGNYCDRIEVSAGFFRSPEFSERGYFIYRFYTTLGRIPGFNEFMPDLAKVSGFLSPQELEANKAAYVTEFMNRSEFFDYLKITDSAGYVNALLQKLGLPEHPGKAAWIAGLTSQTLTRAQVLRAILESGEVYNKYYNEAFVVMQYFGYLRRSPDILYLDWIKTMNQTGDYRTMINGFVNSQEYQQRFGP